VFYRFVSYTFLLSLLLLGIQLNAQDCFELKNEAPSNREELVATASKKLSKRSPAVVEAGEDAMKKDLLIRLSEKIIIDVKSGSTNFVQDDGNAIIQLFTSETRINSNTRLGNVRFEFCFDKRRKTLFGRCRLDKVGLAESITKDCVLRLIALNAEMNGLVNSNNNLNIRPIIRKYEEICSDFQSAVFLNHRIATDDWNKQVVEYNNSLSAISNSDAYSDFKSGIEQANERMAKDEYEEAITLLKNLRKRQSQNEEIEYTLNLCFERYLSYVRSVTAKFIQQNEYSRAIDLVNTYCSVAICNSEAKRIREELRRGYFDYAAEMLDKALRGKDDISVTAYYNTLASLSDISVERHKDLTAKYRMYNVERQIQKARSEKEKRNFWEAYSLLNTTELNYGVSTSEMKKLKENIFRKIAQLEIREEKKNRPHLNTCEFGAEALMNDLQLSNLSSYRLTYMNLGFSAGVYFKYNFGSEHYKKGYPVRSDLIGAKARLVNYTEVISFVANDSIRELSNSKYQFELGADGVLTRIFHYNLSAVYNERVQLHKPSGMSASFGLRIPIHRVALGVDARYLNLFNSSSSVNFVAYFHGNLHFNRKFSNADKRQVRAKLKDY
jgi:hypothetical protein